VTKMLNHILLGALLVDEWPAATCLALKMSVGTHAGVLVACRCVERKPTWRYEGKDEHCHIFGR
jgi:hypothetical protein